MRNNPSLSNFTSWLTHLRELFPPLGVAVVGAGNGSWGRLLDQWAIPFVSFIEANEHQCRTLQKIARQHANWHVINKVVGSQSEELNYFQASNSAESGIIQPEHLVSLWPNLKTNVLERRQVDRLDQLLDGMGSDYQQNWLVIECMPALPVLLGAGERIRQFEIIIARTLLSACDDNCAMLSKNELDAWLLENGFRFIAMQEERQPLVVNAIYIRDWHVVVQTEKKLLEELQQQVEQLRKVKSTVEKIASERLYQLEQRNKDMREQAKLLQEKDARIDQLVKEKVDLDRVNGELERKQQLMSYELLKVAKQLDLIKELQFEELS